MTVAGRQEHGGHAGGVELERADIRQRRDVGRVHRRDRLGGLIHDDHPAARDRPCTPHTLVACDDHRFVDRPSRRDYGALIAAVFLYSRARAEAPPAAELLNPAPA